MLGINPNENKPTVETPMAISVTQLRCSIGGADFHEDAKSRLEELQAEIRLQTGRNVTQQELLTRLIDDAYESRDEVIDSFRDSRVPLAAEAKAAMRQNRFHSGVETDEQDIDDVLYG